MKKDLNLSRKSEPLVSKKCVYFFLLSLCLCNTPDTISSQNIYSHKEVLKTIFEGKKYIIRNAFEKNQGKMETESAYLCVGAENNEFDKRNLGEFANQESLVVRIDSIHITEIGGKEIAVIMLQFTPPNFECRNCEPSIGVATFIKDVDKNIFRLMSYQGHILNYGNYGTIGNDYAIVKLSDEKIGLKFIQGYMGQGNVGEQTKIFANDTNWRFEKVFAQITYNSNEGACDTVNISCEETDCKMSIAKSKESRVKEIVIKCKKYINGRFVEEDVDTFQYNGRVYERK